MQLIERILVATDLSAAADDAVKVASYLAQAFESEVVLLYVMPPLPDVAVPSELLKEQIAKCLAAVQQKLVDDGIKVGDPVSTTGEPFVKIIDCAEEHDVNVIIVGSGDKKEDDEYRLGINAERLERGAQRPVLVVRPDTAPPLRRIICPVDFSDASRRALREASHLARALKSRLNILTVLQPLTSILPSLVSIPEDAQQKHREETESKFAGFVREFDLHDVEHETAILEGQPHEEILKYVKEQNGDLLVMGSVGRTGLSRVLIGSVAEKVARALPCSIMTVKGEDFIRLQLEGEIEDIREHIQRAKTLLEKGFAREALGEFNHCIARDPTYAPAWEGAASVHDRLGNERKAADCRQRAEQIIRTLWDTQIEAEIRSQLLRRK